MKLIVYQALCSLLSLNSKEKNPNNNNNNNNNNKKKIQNKDNGNPFVERLLDIFKQIVQEEEQIEVRGHRTSFFIKDIDHLFHLFFCWILLLVCCGDRKATKLYRMNARIRFFVIYVLGIYSPEEFKWICVSNAIGKEANHNLPPAIKGTRLRI